MDLSAIGIKEETFYAVRSRNGNIIARCSNWDDAVVIAERHCGGTYIRSTQSGVDYYRHERTTIEYVMQESVSC